MYPTGYDVQTTFDWILLMSSRRLIIISLIVAISVPSTSYAQVQLIPWLARVLLGVGERSAAMELAAVARTARASGAGTLIRAESSKIAAASILKNGQRLEKTQVSDVYKIFDASNKLIKIVDFAREYESDNLIACGNGLYAVSTSICPSNNGYRHQEPDEIEPFMVFEPDEIEPFMVFNVNCDGWTNNPFNVNYQIDHQPSQNEINEVCKNNRPQPQVIDTQIDCAFPWAWFSLNYRSDHNLDQNEINEVCERNAPPPPMQIVQPPSFPFNPRFWIMMSGH